MEQLIGLLVPGVFVLFIAIAILVRVAAGSFDGDRVAQYIHSIGGTLLDKSWDPFGPGWFGEKESRIYQIVYRDRAGYIHRAHVKTSTFSGVYLTNDHIIQHPQPVLAPPLPSTGQRPPALPAGFSERSPEAIEREKIQLRQRLAELERISPKERGTSGTPEEERNRNEKPASHHQARSEPSRCLVNHWSKEVPLRRLGDPPLLGRWLRNRQTDERLQSRCWNREDTG